MCSSEAPRSSACASVLHVLHRAAPACDPATPHMRKQHGKTGQPFRREGVREGGNGAGRGSANRRPSLPLPDPTPHVCHSAFCTCTIKNQYVQVEHQPASTSSTRMHFSTTRSQAAGKHRVAASIGGTARSCCTYHCTAATTKVPTTGRCSAMPKAGPVA
jgi:hypothetical protein